MSGVKASPLLALALIGAFAVPAGASAEPSSPIYSGSEFQDLYDYAVENTLPNLIPPSELPAITGDLEVDARIWELAMARGYRLRPEAGEGLVSVDGVVMQPQAAVAWEGLRHEARAAGYTFIVSSAYRSVPSQRSWFLGKLEGTSDQAIDDTLRWYSVPGASKHHGGYALDFRYREGTFGDFRNTPDFAWLSADNFAIPKKYGFIPSYPDDVEDQGPNPEPWEFVWVGTDLIHCGIPLDLSQSRYAASYRWLDPADAACPGSITVEDLDHMFRGRGPKLLALLRV